ncbi:MAG: FHA domain-containing protein [Acidobacteria bacterium]|nr:FHA domain-containing protein [Acidobacteriota bacterium]
MAKLILTYEAAVLKEIPLQKASLSIGRGPSNDVVIDNLAVSGHHAKLVLEEDHYVVEDMNSLNGTFLNKQRIRRSALKDGDEILIGKHTLVYSDEGGVPAAQQPSQERTEPLPPAAEATMVLDTKKRREFLAQATAIASEGASAATKEKLGCLTVLSGSTDQREYILTSKLCVIGKSDMASVKLKGWFAPNVAAIINRREGHYEIAPSDKAGVTKVNSQVLSASRELQEGDLIQIGGVKMQFYFRE